MNRTEAVAALWRIRRDAGMGLWKLTRRPGAVNSLARDTRGGFDPDTAHPHSKAVFRAWQLRREAGAKIDALTGFSQRRDSDRRGHPITNRKTKDELRAAGMRAHRLAHDLYRRERIADMGRRIRRGRIADMGRRARTY